jgi:hypothetical protein
MHFGHAFQVLLVHESAVTSHCFREIRLGRGQAFQPCRGFGRVLHTAFAMETPFKDWVAGPLPYGLFKPPHAVAGEPLLIVWDIQNVRMPDEVDPEELLR